MLAERLVRRLCPECKTPVEHKAIELPKDFKPSRTDTLFQPGSCKACLHRGYIGRIGVYEILRMSDHTRELVMARKSAPQIAAEAAKESNLYTLRHDAFEKVRQGVTTIEEASRAIAT